MSELSFQTEFKEQAIFRLNENTPRIQGCLDLLTEDQIWHKPNSNTNSIANLVLHLCGNITQYAISSLSLKPDSREREKEFTDFKSLTKNELLQKINAVVEEACSTISKLPDPELLRIRSVQGFQFSGIGIITHVVEHYSYHTGQIALYTKLLNNTDLGFYADLDLTIKNE